MTRFLPAVIIGAGVFVLIVFSVQRAGPTMKTASPPFDILAQKARWHERISSGAAEAAYEDFLEEAGMHSYDEAHTLSHIVGEEMYAARGDAGLAICTPDFGYGCYHGFAGAALSGRGLEAVTTLSEPCAAMRRGEYLGCIHGIGHGILSFLGNEHLTEALDACTPAQRSEPVGGCYGGVIMEYNYQTMQSPVGIELRPFDEAHAYEPCTVIAQEYRNACYFELPSWWQASLVNSRKGTHAAIFEKAGALCNEVQSAQEKRSCFEGIGNVIGPRSEYVADTMRAWCALMPDTEAQDVCFVRALAHLLQSEKGRKELRILCDARIVTDEELCASDAI